jgi:hypothetical protein
MQANSPFAQNPLDLIEESSIDVFRLRDVILRQRWRWEICSPPRH